MMSQFNINPQLTGIIQEIGPCDGGFIAEKLFPTIRVSNCQFGWVDWKCSNQYDVYDDKVGCYSGRNEIDPPIWEYKYDKVEARYLDTKICELDLACHNAGGCNNPTFDIEAMRVEMLFNKLRLAREVRAIRTAFDETQYVDGDLAGGKTDYTGILQDEAAGLQTLTELINCLDGRYCLVVSKKTAVKLMFKPAFLNKNCCAPNFGLKQNLQNIADLLGLEQIIISDVQTNVAPKGLPKDLKQLLGDDALLIRNGQLPGTDCPERTFGFTAQFRDTYASRHINPCEGGRGSITLTAGWEIKEVVADRTQAHLIQNICAV